MDIDNAIEASTSTTDSTGTTDSHHLSREEVEATGRIMTIFYDAIVKCAIGAGADGAGIPTIAKRVGCSILTCKKHVNRAVNNGDLIQWKGPKGALYGKRPTEDEATTTDDVIDSDAPWGEKDMDVIVRKDGKLTTIAATIMAATRSKERIRVVLSGKEQQAAWDPDRRMYIGRGFTVEK